MDQTSGFAATLSIGQPLLQRLVRALYNAKKISQKITATVGGFSANLFLGLPVITLGWSHPSQVTLDLTAWGPLTVTPPLGSAETRRVIFTARIRAGLRISIQGGKLSLGFDTGDFSIVEHTIVPYAGGPFSQATLDYLASPEFQTTLQLGIQVQLGSLSSQIPPIDVSGFGALTSGAGVTASHVIREGALVIGLDVDTPELTTNGNTTQLSDSTNGFDIGMWTAPEAVPFAYSFVREKIADAVAASGATLDQFGMEVQEGKFHISGAASKTGGGVDFTLDSVPQLIRPGRHEEWDEEYGGHFEYTTPSREELWFEAQNVHVNAHLDWWDAALASIGSVLTLGIGALIVEALLTMVRGNVSSAIQQDGGGSARVQQFKLDGVTRPLIQQKLETFECHEDGVYVGTTIKADFWGGSLEGPPSIAAEQSEAELIVYTVGLPADASTDDPEIRIEQTVRRTDTNAFIVANIVQAGISKIYISHSQIPVLEVDRLSIEVRIYRALGTAVTELFYAKQYANIVDYVDRTHKYVQWQHESFVPIVRVESNGSQTVLGSKVVHRHSAIHRTALPGRCRMLKHASTQKFGDWRGYPPVYTDDLPFPLADIIAHRAILCDYCFFGGPSKDVPLIPIT